MDPIYMAALMHGEISLSKKKEPVKEEPPKIPLYVDIEKQLNAYVDGLELEEEITHRGLLSPKAKRERIKLEIKAAAKLSKLNSQIETAIHLIYADGMRLLSREQFEHVQAEFDHMATYLENMQLDQVAEESLQHLAHISDESMQSIAEMAVAKFSEEQYTDCSALFSLLTMLNPANFEYWFRQGIAAQKSGDVELAIRAYTAASTLEPNFIGARLLATESFIERKQLHEARAELLAAKEIASKQQVDQEWLALIPLIESRLSNAS